MRKCSRHQSHFSPSYIFFVQMSEHLDCILQFPLLFALNIKGTGEYDPQEFNPTSGEYQSSEQTLNSYLIFDAQVIYKLKPEYQIIIGSKNIGNHTNQAFGPYIGRTAYVEINTNYER